MALDAEDHFHHLAGVLAAKKTTTRAAMASVDRLRAAIAAFATAGCELVEIAEPDAAGIATDPAAAAAFTAAHRALIDGNEGIHASLAHPFIKPVHAAPGAVLEHERALTDHGLDDARHPHAAHE